MGNSQNSQKLAQVKQESIPLDPQLIFNSTAILQTINKTGNQEESRVKHNLQENNPAQELAQTTKIDQSVPNSNNIENLSFLNVFLKNSSSLEFDQKKTQLAIRKRIEEKQKRLERLNQELNIKRKQTVRKLNNLQEKIMNCRRIYEEFDSMEESDEEQKEKKKKRNNQRNFNADDTDEAVIWGQKVNLKNKELEYDLYRNLHSHQNFNPKEQPLEEYRNWKQYKRQVIKESMKQFQKDEERIRKEEKQLIQAIALTQESKKSLEEQLGWFNRGKSSSNSSRNINLKQIQNSIEDKTSLADVNRSKQSIPNNQSFLKGSNTDLANQSLVIASADKNKQPIGQSSAFNDSFLKGFLQPHNNQQNIPAEGSEVDYLSRQILYYQMNLLKRKVRVKTSDQPVQNEEQQYFFYDTNREIRWRPVRTRQTMKQPYRSKSRSASKRKRKKQRESTADESYETHEKSLYYKVYEKLPDKSKTATVFVNSEGKLQESLNQYPWEKNEYFSGQMGPFPNTLLVNDSLRTSSDDNQGLMFRTRAKEKDESLGLDIYDRKRSNLSIPDAGEKHQLTDEQKRSRMNLAQQRKRQAKILEKVKFKHG